MVDALNDLPITEIDILHFDDNVDNNFPSIIRSIKPEKRTYNILPLVISNIAIEMWLRIYPQQNSLLENNVSH